MGIVARFRVDIDPKTGRVARVDTAVEEKPMFSYVLAQLELSKGALPQVANESGVPYRTLQKIASGETKDPGVCTVQKLYDYFRGRVIA